LEELYISATTNFMLLLYPQHVIHMYMNNKIHYLITHYWSKVFNYHVSSFSCL